MYDWRSLEFVRPDCVPVGPLSALDYPRESFEAFFCSVYFAPPHSSNSLSTPVGLTNASNECPYPSILRNLNFQSLAVDSMRSKQNRQMKLSREDVYSSRQSSRSRTYVGSSLLCACAQLVRAFLLKQAIFAQY